MQNNLIASVLLAALVSSVGCANRLAPKWYRQDNSVPGMLVVKFTASSENLKRAIQRAEQGARKKLAEQVSHQVRDLRQALEKEIRLNEQPDLLDFFNKRVKAIVTAHLYKIQVKKQQTVSHEGMWHTFIVLAYPLDNANRALVEAFRREQEMYNRIRQAPAFAALEKSVEQTAAARKN